MKNLHIGVLAAIALAAGAGGYYAYQKARLQAAAVSLPPPAPPPASGQSSPPADVPPEAQSTAIPEEVPDLTLVDLAGKRHALRDAGGHARLFNFWATWCEPCLREIPLLNTLQRDHAAEGLQVVGIAVDMREAVRKFLRTTPMRYTLLVGEDDGLEAAQKFGMALALPFSVFADEHNRIIAVKLGELHREEAATILANMRALRAGTTTLAAAREDITQALKALAIDRAKQSPGI